MEMYAGRVTCCSLVSHVEYAPTGQTDRRTDGRQTVTLRFPLDEARAVNKKLSYRQDPRATLCIS